MVLDVRRFFPSIDYGVMRGFLFGVVRDPEVRALVAHIIDASAPSREPILHFPGDELFTPLARAKDLPIGDLTSLFFADVLLDQVDHHVQERLRVKAYLQAWSAYAAHGDTRVLRAPAFSLRCFQRGPRAAQTFRLATVASWAARGPERRGDELRRRPVEALLKPKVGGRRKRSVG